MTELQCADQEARHDLVAYTQTQHGIKHTVGKCDGRRHGDDIAREQRQLHARHALRYAIAHGRNATGELRNGARLTRGGLDDLRKSRQRLVRGEHIVIGRDNADIRFADFAQGEFAGWWFGGKGMRKIGTGDTATRGTGAACGGNTGKIGFARYRAARLNARGDGRDDGVDFAELCFHACSR